MSRKSKRIEPAKPRVAPQQRKPASGPAAAVCGLLLAAIAIVFGQTVQHDFVDYDDNTYVYDNPHVQSGLTPEGVGWALGTSHGCLWAPLTWTSYLLDFQLYGLRPWGYHLTNVLLHAANAIALFLVLRRATGDLWPSAFAAAIFALHPLQAESVAWVAERKGLLSGLFFLLTIGAYLGYVRHPASPIRYLAVVTLFALGLMSKPMVVTLPFVLLLLDYWPLGRVDAHLPASKGTVPFSLARKLGQSPMRQVRGLLVEKIPLFLLTAVSCVTTPLTQGEAVTALGVISGRSRIINALVSYVGYAGHFLYPAHLAAGYPHFGAGLPLWKGAAALLALAAVSLAALACRRRAPYLLVGWFWFVGMLVPAIGLVQVGWHAMADRYTYLPQIGLCLAVTWAAVQVSRPWPGRRWICGVASTLALAVLMAVAWRQAAFWRNSETLWRHALTCTTNNALAHRNLGCVLLEQGNRADEAIEQFERALAVDPDSAPVHASLAGALAMQGRIAEAIDHAEKALAIQPECVDAHNNLGIALAKAGRFDEAIARFQIALRLQPGYARAQGNIKGALAIRDAVVAELARRRDSIRRNPNDAALMTETAWMLATNPNVSIRDGAEAVKLGERSVRLTNQTEPASLDALAAAYAETGRFVEAVQTARKALNLAKQQGNKPLAEAISARIRLYEAGIPFREM